MVLPKRGVGCRHRPWQWPSDVPVILRQSEVAHRTEGDPDDPPDACGAPSQASIDYMLEQNLQKELSSHGVKWNVATVITWVLVDKNNTALRNPSKPIGDFMSGGETGRQERDIQCSVVEDARHGWLPVNSLSLAQGGCGVRYNRGAYHCCEGRRHSRRRRYPSP
jgi:hypothetical protein